MISEEVDLDFSRSRSRILDFLSLNSSKPRLTLLQSYS